MSEKKVRKHLRPLWKENAEANIPFVKHVIEDLPNYQRKKPAVVMGAGYGLEDKLTVLLDKITDCKNPPVLIACDKALPKCYQIGLVPNYVVALNTEHTSEVRVRDWFARVEEFDTKLVLPITAHPSHVRFWFEKNRRQEDIYWMVPSNIDEDLASELADEIESASIPRGSNAGEFAYLMACFMQSNPIGLIGMPYGYKSLVECLRGQSKDNYEFHQFHNSGLNCYTTLGWMEQRTEFLEMVKSYSKVESPDGSLLPWIETFNSNEGGILYDEFCKRLTIEEFLELHCQ